MAKRKNEVMTVSDFDPVQPENTVPDVVNVPVSPDVEVKPSYLPKDYPWIEQDTLVTQLDLLLQYFQPNSPLRDRGAEAASYLRNGFIMKEGQYAVTIGAINTQGYKFGPFIATTEALFCSRINTGTVRMPSPYSKIETKVGCPYKLDEWSKLTEGTAPDDVAQLVVIAGVDSANTPPIKIRRRHTGEELAIAIGPGTAIMLHPHTEVFVSSASAESYSIGIHKAVK